jgi:hypothetical protein
MGIRFKSIVYLFVLISLNNYESWSQPSGTSNNVYRLVGMTDSLHSGSNAQVIYNHSFTYDQQGRPVSHIMETIYKRKLSSTTADTFQYNYDEKNGRLVSQSDHHMRYNYFYDSIGNLKRIALEFFNSNRYYPAWDLVEETLMEQKELPGNKRLLFYTMNKASFKDGNHSLATYCKIDYIIDASNSIVQSKVYSYSYKNFDTPKEIIYSYDNKPNPLQQIFIERWHEFDLENGGLTNFLTKKVGNQPAETHVYEYNEYGYPVTCTINGAKKRYFKYERIEVTAQKPIERLNSKDKSSMLLYPNPAHTEITIRADGLGEGIAHVRLYDMNGRAFKEVSYTVSNTLEALIPVGGISRGMYILEIIAPKATVIKKLILQ